MITPTPMSSRNLLMRPYTALSLDPTDEAIAFVCPAIAG
jgi:hypothetical protein